jgi:cytochrome c1
MLKFDDGTPASTPQMASDVATFLDFIENSHWPDQKVHINM